MENSSAILAKEAEIASLEESKKSLEGLRDRAAGLYDHATAGDYILQIRATRRKITALKRELSALKKP